MTGDDEVYEAAFKRVGVLRVREVADLFHAAEVLDSRRLPVGPGVAIVTNAGGLGVMATDSLVEHGGRLAELSEKTMGLLDAALPPYWSHANPVDVLGDATSDRFVAAVKACLADTGVNGVILLYTPQGNARPDEMAKLRSRPGEGFPEAGHHRADGRRHGCRRDARSSRRPRSPATTRPRRPCAPT